jgi:hypothetical protein
LVVKTHNGQGVAKGSAICCNYGLQYDLQAEPFALDDQAGDQRIKKFRGALDAVFAQTQSPESAGLLQQPQEQVKKIEVTPKKPPPSIQDPTQTPPPMTKPSTPKPPAALPAAPPLPVPPSALPPKPTETKPPPPAGAAKDVVVASNITDHNFKLLMSDGKLNLLSEAQQNHKLAPRTALLLIRDAVLQEQKDGESPPVLPFALKGEKDAVIEV